LAALRRASASAKARRAAGGRLGVSSDMLYPFGLWQ
jgi:hypothetical protein